MRQPQGNWEVDEMVNQSYRPPVDHSDPGRKSGSQTKDDTLVSTAFPSGHLTLTPFQDLKDFKSRLPVSARPHSFSPSDLRPPLGRSSRVVAPRVKPSRGAFEGAGRRQLEREAR